MRAEIGEFMGLGSTPVVIPANVFERKGDRVEIQMTADEVKDTIQAKSAAERNKNLEVLTCSDGFVLAACTKPGCESDGTVTAPQHFLNFRPEPQGHG